MFYNNSAKTSGVRIENNQFRNGTEGLVRFENNWTENPVLDKNIYSQKNPDVPAFRWLNQFYKSSEFADFQTKTNQEKEGKIKKP